MSGVTGRLAAVAAGLGAAGPPEGAGSLAAGVVALAAGLCESLARASPRDDPLLRGSAVQAVELRERAVAAGSANARAYETARVALQARAAPGSRGRDAELLVKLTAAADTLVAITAVAADCAQLACELSAIADPALQADALGACELGAAAASAAAELVAVNLVVGRDQERRRALQTLTQAAGEAVARARDRLRTEE